MQLNTFMPYQLAVTAEAFSRQLVEVYNHEFGLSREEWRMLFLLADVPHLTSLDLSKRTSLDKVQVSRAATRLEDKGLIERDTSPKDRRLRLYSCTKRGRQLFEKVHPLVSKRAETIFNAMTVDDLDALMRGLSALKSAIDETMGSESVVSD